MDSVINEVIGIASQMLLMARHSNKGKNLANNYKDWVLIYQFDEIEERCAFHTRGCLLSTCMKMNVFLN